MMTRTIAAFIVKLGLEPAAFAGKWRRSRAEASTG